MKSFIKDICVKSFIVALIPIGLISMLFSSKGRKLLRPMTEKEKMDFICDLNERRCGTPELYRKLYHNSPGSKN